MKKLLLFSVIMFSMISCMEDKKGNSPLIKDADGNLVDNPAYHTDKYYEVEENYKGPSEQEKEEMKKIQNNMRRFADSVANAKKKK